MFLFLGIFVWISTVSAGVYSRNSPVYKAEAQQQTGIGPEISFLNVDRVWRENNITGRNVVVAVLDDGLDHNHIDLRANYKRDASYDFVDNDYDPTASWQSRHGTQCAGIIAAKLHGKCRTGIAYHAKLAGVRILSKSHIGGDNMKTKGLGYKNREVDIYSNSWGPADTGYNIKGPNLLGQKALKHGAFEGRNGLGSIFVFSSGNGGFFGDSCAFDGYVNSIYTIAIGAVTKTGAVPRYAESCSSILASTYGDEVRTSDVFNRCSSKFGKTSGAAAFASGIIALLLEANNKLTWRDVQHLIIRTSNPKKVKIGIDWIVNGAGLMVHPSVGFGVMDAKKLVDVAQHWKKVPKQNNCSLQWNNQAVTVNRSGGVFDFHVPKYKSCSNIKALEHVQIEVSLSFYPRAYMLMYLESPSETKSQLLYHRMFDAITQRRNYTRLIITSLHFWGENPALRSGGWRMLFNSANFRRPSQVRLHKLKITFYGTRVDPISKNTILPHGTILCEQGGKRFWRAYGSQCCGLSRTYNPNHEICCSGTKKIVEKESWCGNRRYNKCDNLCCDGTLDDQFISRYGEKMFCCGKRSYSKAIDVCCGKQLKRKSSGCKHVWIRSKYNGWYISWYIHERKCSNGQRFTDFPIYNQPCSVPRRRYWNGRKK